MKKVFVGVALVLSMSLLSGCIIEVDEEWCRGGTCYTVGATCDFYDDQDCFNRTQAWWCNPSDGRVYLNDCIQQCATYAPTMPYVCCGYDPLRGDDACLCCADSTCSGYGTCHI
ncbi:MAG: hypothetical protein JXB32_06600 [Deltaproteobacteria bacterium]|nr:hypothetical protein [Deltaproteobacteria bacterium]